MRLILNKALDNINDNVNIKIIEIISTDFLNNDLNYFVYKNQIPLIKFTDTEESFNVKNSKLNISPSLSETEIILDETDLELISGLGGAGGSQDLQSVLDIGSYAYISNTDATANSYIEINGYQAGIEHTNSNTGNRSLIYVGENSPRLTAVVDAFGTPLITTLIFQEPIAIGTGAVISIPAKPIGVYIIATTDDILHINLDSRIYTDNAAAISGGLVAKDLYRTSTGEIRIVV